MKCQVEWLCRQILLAMFKPGVWVLLAVLIANPTGSTMAQGALTITKTASEIYVGINQVVTYTITIGNAGVTNVFATMVDVLPFGVTFVPGSATGGASYAGGQMIWSGTVNGNTSRVFTFQVTVVEPETIGPLPILNRACVDDGVQVCDSVTIYSSWHRAFFPIVVENYAPPPAWPALK